MQLYLRVKPKASKNQVKKITDNLYEIQVTVSPTRGQANKAVIKLLAEYLKLKPNQIFLKKGLTGKHKIVEVLEL